MAVGRGRMCGILAVEYVLWLLYDSFVVVVVFLFLVVCVWMFVFFFLPQTRFCCRTPVFFLPRTRFFAAHPFLLPPTRFFFSAPPLFFPTPVFFCLLYTIDAAAAPSRFDLFRCLIAQQNITHSNVVILLLHLLPISSHFSF